MLQESTLRTNSIKKSLSDVEDVDLQVPEIEIPDINLDADFDVPDMDFNVNDI